MSKTDIMVTAVSASIAFVAILALAAFSQVQTPERSQSASVTGSPAASSSYHLSMGPDPGGKTGDTVTPATTKTGQPSADGAAVSKEAGASSAAAPGVASDGTSTRTGPGGESRR